MGEWSLSDGDDWAASFWAAVEALNPCGPFEALLKQHGFVSGSPGTAPTSQLARDLRNLRAHGMGHLAAPPQSSAEPGMHGFHGEEQRFDLRLPDDLRRAGPTYTTASAVGVLAVSGTG